jgi:hypothetical protein
VVNSPLKAFPGLFVSYGKDISHRAFQKEAQILYSGDFALFPLRQKARLYARF